MPQNYSLNGRYVSKEKYETYHGIGVEPVKEEAPKVVDKKVTKKKTTK